MRKRFISITTLALAIFASTAFAQNGTIKIEISGINEIKGLAVIGLYKNSDNFPDVTKSYLGVYLLIKEEKIKYSFSNIPNGTYAIAVFHDRNSNKKLDKNFLGIPKEGYAFSNNAKANFGAPGFDEAKFDLKDTYAAKLKITY